MTALRKPFVLACYGTSLTTGRLSGDWPVYLRRAMMQAVECKGEVIILNLGKGSQTSDWGLANASRVTGLAPNHILFEGFGINDCAIGPVSLATAAANFDAMVAAWSAIPGVVMCHQTMSPAWVSDAARTNLQTYYDQEKARAIVAGISTLDHTPAWPAIDATNTFNGDCLHPKWASVFETYSFPAILTWARSKMATFWP